MANVLRKMTTVASPRVSNVTNRNKIHSGYLYKQGAMFNKKFQKRWFILYEGKALIYYANEMALSDVKGEIQLTQVTAIRESKSKVDDKNAYQHTFEIVTNDRTYLLAAQDIKSMNTWIDYISSTVFGNKIHEGWLTKQGDLVKSWKRRYFVLTDTKLLRYFEDEEQTKFKGAIDVTHIKSIKEGDAVEPYWNFIIHLQTGDRLWLLNADSEAKRQEWLNMLDEGKKTINYDANAALFVDIQQQLDTEGSISCKTNQRIKYVLQLYAKWCQANNQYQNKPAAAATSTTSSSNTLSPSAADGRHNRTVSTGFKAAGSNKSKGIWEIINNDLKDYNTVQLLNDFHFVLQHYGARRHKFVEFYKFVNGQASEGPDVPPQESLILMRNMRNRLFYAKYGVQRRMMFNDSEDSKEICAQNLMDRMYAYVMYSFDTLALSPIEWGRIKDYDETERLITSKQMFIEKRAWMKNAKTQYRLNTRRKKFMLDVVQQKEPQGDVAKSQQNEEQKEKTDEDNDAEFCVIPPDFNRLDVEFKTDAETETEYFQFGRQQFVYWEDEKESQWFIAPLYESLKEEMLQNKLCALSVEQWNDVTELAANLSESNRASEFLSYDGFGNDVDLQPMVEKYGIYEFTPIKMNHICSLLLHSNYYQLQQMLLSTYSPNITEKESVSEWKARHAQFAHFAKLLRESCQIFGKPITEQDAFYFSVSSDAVDFGKSLKTAYFVPLSMTRDLFVAQSYFEFDAGAAATGNANGMLLSVTQQPERVAFYMDCSWCSATPQEREVIVFASYPNLARIQSMVHVSLDKKQHFVFNNYQYYLSAMSDLERMVNGKPASDAIGRDSKIALHLLIKYKFGEVDEEDGDDHADAAQDTKQVVITAADHATSSHPDLMISITESKKSEQKEAEVAAAVNEAPETEQKAPNETAKPEEANPSTAASKPEAENTEETKAAEKDKKPEAVVNASPKVRPKGQLKSKKRLTMQTEQEEQKVKEIVFKLKAKRKRKVPDYVKHMFDEYCLLVKFINIDVSRMVSLKHGYREWKDIFMNESDSWIKLDVLVKLFPNLTDIKVTYIPQAFTKQTAKSLIDFLKSECLQGREIQIRIYRPNKLGNTYVVTGDSNDSNKLHDDNKADDVADFTLQTALTKYLQKKSKVGANFQWFCRLNEDERIPFLEIIRPHKAVERNKELSCILDEAQMNKLMQLLQAELMKNKEISDKWYLNLLYRASRDSFEASKFHECCDGIGHTISIIKSTNENCVFAAYTSKPWGRTGKWVEDEYAFVIPMKSVENARVINIKKGHEQFGMYLQSNGGPGFGKGDIKILNKANQSSRNTCNSNSFAFNLKPNELVGGNGSYFKVADYEVFQAAFY